jgi:hypothetical protein
MNREGADMMLYTSRSRALGLQHEAPASINNRVALSSCNRLGYYFSCFLSRSASAEKGL